MNYQKARVYANGLYTEVTSNVGTIHFEMNIKAFNQFLQLESMSIADKRKVLTELPTCLLPELDAIDTGNLLNDETKEYMIFNTEYNLKIAKLIINEKINNNGIPPDNIIQVESKRKKYPELKSLHNNPFLIPLYATDAEITDPHNNNDAIEYKLTKRDVKDYKRKIKISTGEKLIWDDIQYRTKANGKDKEGESSGSANNGDDEEKEGEKDEEDESGKSEAEPNQICSNFLFFKLALEGYLGYNCSSLNSLKTHNGKWAIMGGSILAALTSVNESHFTKIKSYIETKEILQNEDHHKQYLNIRKETVYGIKKYFLHTKKKDNPFKDGDVDIFTTGGEHFASSFINNLESKATEATEAKGGGLYYCRTRHVLSFYHFLGELSNIYENYEAREEAERLWDKEGDVKYWYRNTQVIMLEKNSDLFGALMDFDIDAAAVAFDGSNVYALPRAVRAISTKTILLRPNIIKHNRNRARIRKYEKRGYRSFYFDFLGNPGNARFGLYNWNVPNVNTAGYSSKWVGKCDGSKDYSDGHADYYKKRFYACCNYVKNKRYGEQSDLGYTQHLTEKAPGHAKLFFQKYYQWSQEQIEYVESRPTYLYMTCRGCRFLYLEYFGFSTNNSNPDDFLEDGDFATEVAALRQERSGMNFPCFQYWYGCGAFPKGPKFEGGWLSQYGKTTFYQHFLIAQRLTRQEETEKMRNMRDNNGRLTNFKTRFIHSDKLDDLVNINLNTFRAPNRPPIGLNPERYISTCTKCHSYIYYVGFTTNELLCENCQHEHLKSLTEVEVLDVTGTTVKTTTMSGLKRKSHRANSSSGGGGGGSSSSSLSSSSNQQQSSAMAKMQKQNNEFKKVKQEKQQEVDRLNNVVDDNLSCVICFESKRELLFRPCNHMACCKDCGKNLTECPMCRQTIESKETVFL